MAELAKPPEASAPPPLTHTVGALTLANALGVAAPLLVVPYLARVLGSTAWGAVLLAQALAAWVLLLLEYAADLAGTRAVNSLPPNDQPQVVWGVQAGKLLLVPVALLLLAGATWALPPLRAQPLLAVATAVAAVARGLSPLWAFVARERVRGALLVDATARVAGALGVLLVVRAPHHGWRVLALQGGAAAVATALLWWRLHRQIPPPTGWIHGAWPALRGGRALFAFRALGTVYQHGSLLLLGALAPATMVSAYGAGERLVRAALNLLEPLSRGVLPRLSRWQATGDAAWHTSISMLLQWLGGGAMLSALAVWLLAPWGVPWLLGAGYGEVVGVVRLLAPLLPLVAVATVLGFYWALPAGHDGLLLRGTAMAGAVNLAVVAALVPRWGARGMAVAVVAAEAVMVVTLARAYARRRRDG